MTTPVDRDELLVLTDVTKQFGAVSALKKVSLSLGRGESRGVVGPNGSGKSSLLNCVAGFYIPSSGRIIYDGAEITSERIGSKRRRGIARTFQNLQLAGSLTLEENAMLGLQLTRVPGKRQTEYARRRTARKALAEWGVEQYADFYPQRVPYGIRKVVETVRALLASPTLLLLDEPAAGLSPHEREAFVSNFNRFRYQNEGVTLILVEHDIAFVRRICPTLTVLDYGNVVCTGPAKQVMSNPDVMRSFLGREPNGDQRA